MIMTDNKHIHKTNTLNQHDKRSSMLSTANQNNNDNKYIRTNYLPPKQIQKSIDFKKRPSQDPSIKLPIRKSASIIHK